MKTGILKSTTILVLAASLSLPAAARAQDYGFDTRGLNTKQIRGQLARLKKICAAAEGRPNAAPKALKGVNCRVVGEVELPPMPEPGDKGGNKDEAQRNAAGPKPGKGGGQDNAGNAARQQAGEPEASPERDDRSVGSLKDLRKNLQRQAGNEARDENRQARQEQPSVQDGDSSDEPRQVLRPRRDDETGRISGAVRAEDLARELASENGEQDEDAAQQRPRQNPNRQDPDRQTANGQNPNRPGQREPGQPTAQQQADAVARDDAATRSAAAAADADNGDAEVVEEQVTERDVRRSDQDFRTRIGEAQNRIRNQQAEASDDDDDDDDKGLSNFETAALLGLGTLALSQILGGDDDARVVENSGDRVVVEQDGQYRVLRNDDVLLRRPGSDVTTYRYDDGSTRTVVAYEDGSKVETIQSIDGRVLRRTRILPDGRSVVLFDDTQDVQEVVVNDLPQVSSDRQRMDFRDVSSDELAAALAAREAQGVDRRFSLNQIRNIDAVRHLVPEVSVDAINFDTGSAAIRPGEADSLAELGNAMKEMIADNPGEVFLIEGHTDAVGAASYNLALSDRRAESVALALTEYFGVPPENMVLQGYGEGDLAVLTDRAERENRRAAVRRITPLLQMSEG